ncbi:magnesium transporter [Brevirhabdus pacifica]|uniref:Magnesium transporter MgtE n=1 Tax=Brevirhabdus pacifica TaxID=1267768 RepID=A0A1U7DG39_9RHOB|nr:magnesium transporter [Brevirhabdus pacifica]APX88970.1 magnesium transporter [Brevirhabdus pacifica]OWU80192.1 magnesium transporter [Loktanella sp. 22II-4b]PJJ86470.1 magnesium transporter [Brevirhabdus pacifica]
MTDESPDLEEREDAGYALDKATVHAIHEALLSDDDAALRALIDPLHPADVADLLEQVSGTERRQLLTRWSGSMAGEILSELDESLREEVIEYLEPGILAEAVRELDSDDVVDLVEDLEQDQQDLILDSLSDADRVAVELSLSYPEESAGRLMQREVVRVPEDWTVGETIDFLRRETQLPEQFYHVILVDPRMRPTGYVTLGKLLGSPRAAPLSDIVEESFRTIPVSQPEEDVAYAFNQYHLISAPVVDEDDRLVGVITIDDAMAVLDEEAEEDLLRLAGVGDERVSDRTLKIARQRFPWLFVNLATAILASLVISQFEAALTQVVALAVLMPIVASMGGNAGTQSLTVAVRALATRDLTGSNAVRVLTREAVAGLLNGAAFALIMGVIAILWFDTPILGAVIAISMVVNLVVAALAGILVPLALEKVGIDPALASGAFVTTVTDVVGFFVFLGLAVILML